MLTLEKVKKHLLINLKVMALFNDTNWIRHSAVMFLN